jgi:hypothetical protein
MQVDVIKYNQLRLVFYYLQHVNSLYQLNFPLSIGLGYHIDSAGGAC